MGNPFRITAIVALCSTLLSVAPHAEEAASEGALSANQIRIATTDWQGYVDEEGGGLYGSILTEAFAVSGVRLHFLFYPFVRAQYQLYHANVDALAVESEYDKSPMADYSDWPLDIGNADYFSCGKDRIDGVESLRGKRVAWMRGYGFASRIPLPQTDYERVELGGVEQALRLIMAGRVDVLVDYDELVIPVAQKLGMDLSQCHFQPAFKNLYLMGFAKTPRGQHFKALYEDGMKKLYASGRLKTLLQDQGVATSTIEPEQMDLLLQFYSEKLAAN